MPGGKEKQGRSVKWQKKRQAPATLQKTWINVVSAKMGLAEKNIKLTEDQKPSKTIGKTTFWGRSNKWQKKRQAPGRHGNGRGPSKSLGKTKGSCRSAAGNGVACWGHLENLTEDQKPSKTVGKTTFWAHTTTWQKKNKPRDAMETAGTLQKTLEKQRVAAGAPHEMEWLAGGHLGNLTEDGKP